MKKKFSAKDKEIFVDKHFKNKKKKDKKGGFSAKDLKKTCIDKIISSNLHIAGLERFCVNEMQFFVSVIKQNICVINLKFFWFNFIRAVRFLLLVSRKEKKVFFLGLPLGIEKPFMQLLKKLNETHLLKSFVIKKEITGILTNFRKLKFKQKLEGVTMLPKIKRKKGVEKKKIFNEKNKRLSKSKKFTLKPKKLDLKIKPSLIFVFQPLEHKNFLEKLSALNVPIMGFVNTSDPMSWYDFPIPGNINSLKGSLFVYNFFNHLSKILSFQKRELIHLKRKKEEKKKVLKNFF